MVETLYGSKLCATTGCLTNISVSQSLCTKCEIVALKAELAECKNNHADMVKRNAELRDRPDLGDRCRSVDSLRTENEKLAKEIILLCETLNWIGDSKCTGPSYQSRSSLTALARKVLMELGKK